MKLEKKRIVVTGAASGVGRALLVLLATRDVHVVAADRDDEGLLEAIASARQQAAQTAAHPTARFAALACDLSQRQQVDALFEFAKTVMGGIDLFFANAGFAYAERTERPRWFHIAEIFETNTFSPIYALQKMLELHDPSDFRFVITSSILGRVALEGWALYAATKAALDRFAEAFRLEQAGHDPLTIVYPGPVASGFFQAAGGAPLPWRAQSPHVVARAMIRGVEKERSVVYTSWLLRPMLLIDRLFPFARRAYQALDSRIFRRWWAARYDPQAGGKGERTFAGGMQNRPQVRTAATVRNRRRTSSTE